MIFFIGDTHFCHANIIKLSKRPFTSVEEMNETLISNWNRKVSGEDTVYILGDLAYRSDTKNLEHILSRLRGRKRLLIGNHDSSWLGCKIRNPDRYFEMIEHMTELSICHHGMTLCHYPLLTYKHSQKHYMIHGHIHNNTDSDYWPLLRNRPLVLNAGVDINNFEPVTLNELIKNNRIWKEAN